MGRIIASEHISLDGVVEAPRPDDIGDHPHKGWLFDFEPGETGERSKLDEALAAAVLLTRNDDQTNAKGTCEHETDDHHARLRRRSDAGPRRAG